MNPAYLDLASVLRETRKWLALPGNDFTWSSWPDAVAALAELDQLLTGIEANKLPARLELAVLFAPTGPIQEVSLSSGWGEEFLKLAERFDQAQERAYFHGSWWQRFLNRKVFA